MSLFGVLNIARDALLAQQAAIDTTGQNVANATTPGYVRRDAQLSTRPVVGAGEGGVEMTGYARSADGFAYSRLVEEEGRQGEASVRADALATIEGLLGPAERGISSAVTDLFSSFTRLSASPADPNLRGEVLTKSEALVRAFGNLAGGLVASRGELAAKAEAEAKEANLKLAEVATLNGRIAEATATGNEAGDLRDRRDVLIRDLAASVGARSIEAASGEVTVFAAGTALVIGSSASTLSVDVQSNGDLSVRAVRSGGSALDVTSKVDGGRLGGYLGVRDTDVPELMSSLDSFAFDLATAVNAVHQTGVGIDGVSGRNLFSVGGPAGAAASLAVDAALASSPDAVAAAATAGSLPGGGDIAVAIAQLLDKPLAGGATPGMTLARLASDLGARRMAAERDVELRADTVAQAEATYSSSSGVSIDEEMVKLTQLQRAFEASTRVLRTADQLLEGLLRDL